MLIALSLLSPLSESCNLQINYWPIQAIDGTISLKELVSELEL